MYIIDRRNTPIPGPKAAVEQLKDNGEEAHRAGLNAKAARFFSEARELAAQNGLEKDRVYLLFWEAYSLVKVGDSEAAMPLLLEAANSRMPEVNPGDAFNAAVWLLEISLGEKPVTFCRDLLAQTREYLAGINKENWGHMLDFLEGSLEFLRGDLPLARQHFLQAWETSPQTTMAYPSYTPATYLEKLFDTAFLLRDVAGMKRWLEAIEACMKEIELDKVRALGARLRMFRVERAERGDFSIAREIALASLDALELVEGNYSRYILDFLRVPMLARRWKMVERRLTGFSIDEGFMYCIFRGDALLCQAREALGAPILDDEYEYAPGPDRPEETVSEKGAKRTDEIKANSLADFLSRLLPSGGMTRGGEFISNPPPAPNPASAVSLVKQAAQSYEQAREEAGAEDKRLDTSCHTLMVDDRLERARALEKTMNCALNALQ